MPAPAQSPQTARLSGHVTAGSCARPIPGITPATCVQFHDFIASRDGTLTATLSWTGTTDMDLVVTQTSCATYDHYACTIRAESRQLPTAERISLPVTRGDGLRFWAHNNSPAAADYAIDVRID